MDGGMFRAQVVAQAARLGILIEMASGVFCVLFFATMVVVMLVAVFFRYVLNNPFEWTEELVRFLWLSLCFLAINIGVRRNEHIGVNVMVDKLPAKSAKILDYMVDFLSGLFLIVLIRQAYLMATHTVMTAAVLEISMFWPYLTLLVGACFAFIQVVVRFITKLDRGATAESLEV